MYRPGHFGGEGRRQTFSSVPHDKHAKDSYEHSMLRPHTCLTGFSPPALLLFWWTSHDVGKGSSRCGLELHGNVRWARTSSLFETGIRGYKPCYNAAKPR